MNSAVAIGTFSISSQIIHTFQEQDTQLKLDLIGLYLPEVECPMYISMME
jgi:hypothetical protein